MWVWRRASKGEELAERGAAYAGGKTRAAIRHHRMKPWRDAAKAEQAAVRANAESFPKGAP